MTASALGRKPEQGALRESDSSLYRSIEMSADWREPARRLEASGRKPEVGRRSAAKWMKRSLSNGA